jgi:hypothetical protein
MGTVSLYTKDELPLVDGVVRKMLGELPGLNPWMAACGVVAAGAVLRHHRHGHGNVECFTMNKAVCHTFVPSTQRAPAPPRA